MSPRKRVALYARVSTAEQDPAMQLDELRDYAMRRGWTVAAEYVDRGESGAKERRPELDKLMAHVRRGGVDVALVWRFDRFARSVRHLVLALDDFRAVSVDFVSVRDAIDTSTPAGRFTFTIIAAVAELERELIRERTIAGVARARRQGKRLGRPRAERRTASQGPRLDVDAARALVAGGVSVRAAARAMGASEATLRRALARAAASESSSEDKAPEPTNPEAALQSIARVGIGPFRLARQRERD